MFVCILLRDVARDFRVEFGELAPSRVLRNQFAGGQEAVRSHLKPRARLWITGPDSENEQTRLSKVRENYKMNLNN